MSEYSASGPDAFPPSKSCLRWRGYLLGLGLVGVATVAGQFLRSFLDPANLVMVYLLTVVISAIYGGLGPSVMVSILGVLAFDFFFVHPFLSFAVDDVQYVMTLIALLLVGFTISYLTSRVRALAIERARLAEISRNALVQERVEKLQNALLNSISHELRTPLVSIVGALSSLQENSLHLDDAARQNLTELAHDEAERLNRLVTNLLDVSRIEAGAMKLSLQPADLAEIVGATLEEASKRYRNVPAISVEIPPDLALVSVDFTLMAQVLNNILDNAIKYSPPDSAIEIKAISTGKNVDIDVSDRGVGIPVQDLARVFDKFYRVHRPDMVTGTGLGLSICKGIVEAHGGSIVARNRVGGGTTIRISLPLAGSVEKNEGDDGQMV